MHVRIAQFRISDGNWDATVREIEDSVVPAIQRVPGFVAGFFVGDRAGDRTWGIVVWESEEAMRASEDTAARIRGGAIEGAGLELTGVERFEVIASVDLPDSVPQPAAHPSN